MSVNIDSSPVKYQLRVNMKQIVLNIKQVVGFAGVGLACLNVLFALLALALDTWIVQCSRGNFGLWKACTNTKCETLSTVSG